MVGVWHRIRVPVVLIGFAVVCGVTSLLLEDAVWQVWPPICLILGYLLGSWMVRNGWVFEDEA